MEKNDKARAVLVYQILRDESGEENRLSLKDIIGKIEKKGISAERRAVTRDIAMLRERGPRSPERYGDEHHNRCYSRISVSG